MVHVANNGRLFASYEVPQVGTYTELAADNAGQISDLMKAVNSIPAYVEKCSHFFCIAPPVSMGHPPGTSKRTKVNLRF